MDQPRTVNINGRKYDPITGLPIGNASVEQKQPAQEVAKIPARSVHAGNVHTVTQRSQTLRRSSLKNPAKPAAKSPVVSPMIQHHKRPTQPHHTIHKAPQIAKFTPHPAKPTVAARPRMMDIGPVKHPHVVRAQAKLDAKAAPAPIKPSHVIKQEAIQAAVENTTKQTKQHKRKFRLPGAVSIVTASLALLVLGGYLTYLNMPSLSVRVAAAAAGVDASYPNYRPDGYRLNGPVAYDEGQVSMEFAANAGPQKFTIKQTKSNWNSAAVLEKYVIPKAGSDYATYSERGLTIYTFDDGVAWVNGGVLYTIEGDARLSSEQVRHLATSFI